MMQMLGLRSASKKKDLPSSSSSDSSDSSPPSTPPSKNPSLQHTPVFAAGGMAGPARPLRLVYCDEKGKFRMDPEAVAALQLVKGPIGIVSVCGRARQGKSFILNQVLFFCENLNQLFYHFSFPPLVNEFISFHFFNHVLFASFKPKAHTTQIVEYSVFGNL